MFKKIFAGIAILFVGFILVACNGAGENGLVISKVFESTNEGNNIVELYNNSSKDVNLKNYTLDIYTNGSKEITRTIALDGTIKANDYFIIGSNGLDSSLGITLDVVFDGNTLPYNGNDVIQLSYKGKIHDLLGFIGSDLEFYRNLTLIRLGEKEDYQASAEYDRYNFIQYETDVFQFLGNDNHEVKTLEDLYAGPRLDDKYKEIPLIDPNNPNNGLGGASLATLTGIADGDTASFKTSKISGSFRYYYIDTPERTGSPYVEPEPWGNVASKYNKEYQLNNPETKELYVQSIPNYTLTDSNGRYIGLIWINGHLSQFLIVSEGLSTPLPIVYEAIDIFFTYKKVPYLTYMLFAEQRARENGWAMFGFPANPDGDKSPDWNYTTNKSSTENPVWQPHLPMPWDN